MDFLPPVNPAHKSRDALYIEQREIKEQLQGISPKLELYRKLQNRLSEIGSELGGQKTTKEETRHIKHTEVLGFPTGNKKQPEGTKRAHPKTIRLGGELHKK